MQRREKTMKNFNPIADGNYICERREILKDFGTWKKMTKEEKDFFRPCVKCPKYIKFVEDMENNLCPCANCPNQKTEIEVDNKMVTLRHKYFEKWRGKV
jgi:hypothetical protein